MPQPNTHVIVEAHLVSKLTDKETGDVKIPQSWIDKVEKEDHYIEIKKKHAFSEDAETVVQKPIAELINPRMK